MTAAGICLGASNIKIAEIARNNQEVSVISQLAKSHEGNARETLKKLINTNDLIGKNIAVTGRKFKSLVQMPSISEPEATELAYNFIEEDYDSVEAIISAGGETFMVYDINDEGQITNVYTGSKCASGTGEFFLQQIKRMGLDLQQATTIAEAENPYRVSGRCSVFCKSDCTHALNKGMDKGKIVAGLCQMMVDKIIELVNKAQAKSVMLVGGLARNEVVVKYLRERLSQVIVPDEAFYFEALGTAIWSEENGKELTDLDNLFKPGESSFEFLPPLKNYQNQVKFHDIERDSPDPGDECILGLDVGSTTTKAVIIRADDDKLLASEYLRTSGDPVHAARECYASLNEQIGETEISIIGLGVTGSGRKITGLHALTESVINEIIAHAAGAVHFDSEVDTIFEIGGQDAKYTYLINGVPTNYAMNEACSAGTGSFLEESAEESLDIAMEDIADIALQGENPPNFNDQCSAFIGSDIKNAVQEGIDINDICAGLVYSICQNYTNRVKGNRPVGDKVFMQGGVCYNQAVPMAMAALTGKEIIVPPEPGLMGAFGVALETKRQLDLGLVETKDFDLDELHQRDVKHLNNFTCEGGSSDCDRKCDINVLEVAGEKHLFGGICNKYMTLDGENDHDMNDLNLVKKREKLLFSDYLSQPQDDNTDYNQDKIKGKVGFNRSLTIHKLLPFYSRFFAELGYEIVLPDNPDETGIQQQSAAFCYPVEVSHGFMHNLLTEQDFDYIFLPHVKGLHVENSPDESIICPMAQGEPFYLSATWPRLENDRVLSPTLDFKEGFENVKGKFIEIGKSLGAKEENIIKAFKKGVSSQQEFENKLKNIGQSVLERLENNENEIATVIFGRPYNAFASETNMGIPHKFASQGELVLPFDMLPIEDEEISQNMYWSMGQMIMKGARFVSRHNQLFGTYITNFSCGPDAFLVSYFRQINGNKPSLTLELDSHTADVGVNTRIEAFLDVIDRYRNIAHETEKMEEVDDDFTLTRAEINSGDIKVQTSAGEKLPLSDDRVKLLIPSMGGLATRAVASAMNYNNIEAVACKPPGESELKRGKAHATGKECLPFLLTMGTMLNYADKKDKDEVMVYFMAESSGPCRLGQYSVMMEEVIRDKELENVGLLSLDAGPGYQALGPKFLMRAWQALAISDVLNDIYSTIRALAVKPDKALEKFTASRDSIFRALQNKSWWGVKSVLKQEAEKLGTIELTEPYEQAQKVALTGEIYVRNDEFSRRFLVDKLAERNIVTMVSPIIEWLYYVDHMEQKSDNYDDGSSIFSWVKNKISNFYKRKVEKDIRGIFASSGLCSDHLIDIEEIVDTGRELVSDELTGETILTIGAAIAELIDDVEGIIAIGPFGCMHHRVSESIIKDKLEEKKYQLSDNGEISSEVIEKFSSLPFLAIETDGNAFPQVIEARLEAFCLQVRRINEFIQRQNLS